MGELDGRRIIVTRSAERARALSELLEARGAEVVEIALTETVDAPDGGQALRSALDRITEYDWLVVTSPHGARLVKSALEAVPRHSVRTAAVGSATSEALGGADLVPDVQTAAALGEAFPTGTGTVLFAAARDAGSDFERAARSKGWTVDRVTAYATRAVVIDRQRMDDAIARADAVVFVSGSAVRAWVTNAGTSAPDVIVAMGPSTEQVLVSEGFGPVSVAEEQSLHGVVETVVRRLMAGTEESKSHP